MRINRQIASAGAALVSGLLVAGLTPAAAKPRPEPAQTTQPATEAPKPETRRYCIMADITGSRIPQKLCKTKQQWALEGVDIDAK